MIVLPLLDSDNSPHAEGAVVEIDLNGLKAYLKKNGSTILSIRLQKDAAGYIEPADPMVARNPGSAFDHTVNVFCNKHNQQLKASNTQTAAKPASEFMN